MKIDRTGPSNLRVPYNLTKAQVGYKKEIMPLIPEVLPEMGAIEEEKINIRIKSQFETLFQKIPGNCRVLLLTELMRVFRIVFRIQLAAEHAEGFIFIINCSIAGIYDFKIVNSENNLQLDPEGEMDDPENLLPIIVAISKKTPAFGKFAWKLYGLNNSLGAHAVKCFAFRVREQYLKTYSPFLRRLFK